MRIFCSCLLLCLQIILFSSCEEKVTKKDFQRTLNQRWLGAQSIQSIHPQIKQGTSIKRPRGTWQHLFTISFLDSGFNLQYDCVYYLVPNDETPGKIAIIFNQDNTVCENLVPDESSLFRENIYNLSYEVNLASDAKQHLKLSIDGDQLSFNFINLKNRTQNDRFFGMKITSMINTAKVKLVNKLTDGTLCFGVDKNCEIKQKFRCNECQNSWHEVISTECSTQYNKVCGRDQCGKRGYPACIRGRASTGYNLSYCINDSPIGFCDEGLRVLCIANQLVCR